MNLLRLTLTGLCGLTVVLAATQIAPPETTLVRPGKLIVATPFSNPADIAAKGKPGWQAGAGTWKIENGAAFGNEGPLNNNPRHEGVCEYLTEVGDAVIVGEFKLGTAPKLGFVCRDTRTPNHHLARFVVTPTAVSVVRMSGIGKQTKSEALQKLETPLDPNTWYKVVIEFKGEEMAARIGGHSLAARDPRFKDLKGRIGIVANGQGAAFRNVAIWQGEPK
jgi:hypothetical protein